MASRVRYKGVVYDKPSIEDLITWSEDLECECPDGCVVEPDGTCEHDQKSWLLLLGMI